MLESDKPVIVDFWAEWCGPCHAVAPVLDRIVEERDGEVKLVKVNIDEERGLAQRYGIASIPTMILFKDGEPAQVAIGAQPEGRARALARPRSRVASCSAASSSGWGIGEVARLAGSSTRFSTRMPWMNTTAPPSQPPSVSTPKPISVSRNGAVRDDAVDAVAVAGRRSRASAKNAVAGSMAIMCAVAVRKSGVPRAIRSQSTKPGERGRRR